MVYRPPMDVTVTFSEADAGVTFYYIAATNGMTQIFPNVSGGLNFDTFSVVFEASETSAFAISILRNGNVIGGSRVSFTMTVIGMIALLMGVVSIRALDLKP